MGQDYFRKVIARGIGPDVIKVLLRRVLLKPVLIDVWEKLGDYFLCKFIQRYLGRFCTLYDSNFRLLTRGWIFWLWYVHVQ
jgi:hypothetical protein